MIAELDELVERAVERPPIPLQSLSSIRRRCQQRRRRRRTVAAAVAVAVIVGGTAAVIGEASRRDLVVRSDNTGATEPRADSNAMIEMPDLVGSSSDEALSRLSELGLVALVIESHEPGGVYDTVVATNPGPGASVVAGSTVDVTVAYPPGEGGPLDYATMEQPLPLWPQVAMSDPPATTSGYGLGQCDSGTATRYASLYAGSEAEHSYYGTLCPFISLIEPRAASVTMCATVTDGLHYAPCQRRIDQSDSTGAGNATPATVTDGQRARIAPYPAATESEESQRFDANLTATINSPDAIDYQDGPVAVTLTEDVYRGQPQSCFHIELSDATADGCLDSVVLRSGLAYAVLQNRNGVIDVVGIVPDDVTSVEIGGTTVSVVNNVWHYAATNGPQLNFTVRSQGDAAST